MIDPLDAPASARVKRVLASSPFALVTLALTNVATFSSHYRGIDQFPYDFPMGYYGFVSYWTTAIRHGVMPEWMPFQEMGYPFFSNLQTGIAYPPLWAFPLAGIEYTMQAATIVQVLHVLWGAIGAYALGRVLFGEGLPALFLGVCYHFFGGFYSNAQHPDIVRAFAWLPWLFVAVHLVPGQVRLTARNYAMPFIVACMVTGSYPGNLPSHLLLVGIYLVALFLPATRPKGRLLLAMLALIGVGIVLAAPMLAPGLALKNTLLRSVERPLEMNWTIRDWVYLIVPFHTGWPHSFDMSMVAACMPLPVFGLLAALREETVRLRAPFLCVLVFCMAMLPGSESRIARMLFKALPVLCLSRYPASDYRAGLVLVLLVLATASFAYLLSRKEEGWPLVRSRAWILGLLFFFLFTGQQGFRLFLKDIALVALGIVAFFAVAKAMLASREGARVYASFGMVLLAGVYGFTVLHMSDPNPWRSSTTRAQYMGGLGFYPDRALPVGERLVHAPTSRPARNDTGPDLVAYSWRGYLEGSYEVRDTTAPTYHGARAILSDPALYAFMMAPWRAVVLPPHARTEASACAALHTALPSAAPTRMRSLRYGVNDAVLRVHLDAPAYVAENETYFAGWQAELVSGGRVRARIEAEPVCDGVRMWRLPAGDYDVRMRYVTPRLRASLYVAGATLAAYVLFLAGVLVRRRASA